MNKLIVFLICFFFFSCNSTKPVVRTTKKPTQKTTTQTVKNNNKLESNSNKSTAGEGFPKSETKNNTSEVLKATSQVKVTKEMVLQYIDDFKAIAQDNMKKYGIPASITLAQGILESGCGYGALSQQANNHFGIKCHKEWTGESVRYDDDEAQECFRKYNHPSESYRDHSLFLTSRTRYASLFQLPKNDYKAWARGLKAAGYATDPQYPDKLIGLIERYQLFKYDTEGTNYANNELFQKEYQVLQGDTLYSISKKFSITVEELKKRNNLKDNSLTIGQKLIIK